MGIYDICQFFLKMDSQIQDLCKVSDLKIGSRFSQISYDALDLQGSDT